MPYVGGKVTVFFDDEVRDMTAATCERMANEGGKKIESVVRKNTPVDTGALRASWQRHDVAKKGSRYTSTVDTEVEYAPDVEFGTGLWGPKHAKYLIKPKKPGGSLRFMVGGRVVFAKYVWHPGSPGNHMMSTAINFTEAEAQRGAMFMMILAKWRGQIELHAEKEHR